MGGKDNMVKLAFSASVEPKINLTLGRSKSEIRWTERRSLTWDELVSLLTTATVGAKDGSCYTPATFSGTARRMDQAERIDIAVLDSDIGYTINEIRNALAAKGWQAIIHSTFNHLIDHTSIAAAPADKWMAEHKTNDISLYMMSKKGYLPRVVENCTISEETKDGSYIVQHAPCPKFRIILPLKSAWIAEDYEDQNLANATWRQRIASLSFALGLATDQSCSDTSRLFYLPRHKAGAEYVYDVLDGDLCPIWDLPDPTPEPAPAPAKPLSFTPVASDHLIYQAPNKEWIDLTEWIADKGPRFEVVKALKARAPHLFGSRVTGVKHHIVCPHADAHITNQMDQTGTFCVNASDLPKAGLPSITTGFVIDCMHAGCAGRDRLSHLHKLLCDSALSIQDLNSPDFLMPDIPQVDPSALLQSSQTEFKPFSPSQGNITPDLYTNLPGVLGHMHAWIMETSLKPQPTLALGAILAFCAAAIGQKVKLGHFHTRPNIYVLGIGHSGSGKERPQSACKQMAKAAGLLEKLIGVEEVASDAGIIASVLQNPHQLMLIDEVSFLLNSANNKNAGAYLANVTGTLLKLYSSSHTTYKMKSYADSEKVKVIDQPCVSFYGSSTPNGLTSSLKTQDINSGLLSRMMIFDVGDNDPRISQVINSDQTVPNAIVDWLTAWDKISPTPNPIHRVGGDSVIEPRNVMLSSDAHKIAVAFEGEMHEAKIAARKNGTDALYVRAFENAMKFALIRACASIMPVDGEIDAQNICVDQSTMLWALNLSRATVKRMEAAVPEIADTPFAQNLKNLLQFIRAGGPAGKTYREVKRHPCGKHPKKMMEDLWSNISGANDAYLVEGMKTKGRKRDAWVHKDFVNQNNEDNEDE